MGDYATMISSSSFLGVHCNTGCESEYGVSFRSVLVITFYLYLKNYIQVFTKRGPQYRSQYRPQHTVKLLSGIPAKGLNIYR